MRSNPYTYLLLIAFVLHAGPSRTCAQNIFYIDPINGNMANDGSVDRPWRTLAEVFASEMIETRRPQSYPYTPDTPLITKNAGAPIKAGDTLLLRNGYHGDVWYRGAFNLSPITIRAQQGHIPELKRLFLSAVSNWIIDGLSISPTYAASTGNNTLIRIESHNYHGPSSNITIQNCTGFSIEDSMAWSAADWVQCACTGIHVNGDNMTLRNNVLRNVDFGIIASGDYILAAHNQIINFSGDGMRGGGSDITFEYNTIKNCYDVDDNHDDGIQFYRGGGLAHRRVILRGNRIIAFEDANQPHRGTLQGIGCFDGPYIDWIVENNVVFVDHWHGISLYDATNCLIRHNTVGDLNTTSPGPPWIRLAGTSSNCTVRNNLTTALSLAGDPWVTADHNIVYSDDRAFFVDHDNRDFHLIQGCAAIDAAIASNLSTDIEMALRPRGEAADIGAYEAEAAPLALTGKTIAVDDSGVGQATATIAGVIVPNGELTSWYCKYGPGTVLNLSSALQHLIPIDGRIAVQITLTGLAADSEYSYRLVAENSLGVHYGTIGQLSTHLAYVEPSAQCGGHQPCYASIQAAIDASPASSTIKIACGGYDENVIIDRNVCLKGTWNPAFTDTATLQPLAIGGPP
jgi:parallel beta-helix repeat protein